jgi:hypothetical protein
MLLTIDSIREILYVKSNCTLNDFLEHLQFLRGHFQIENTRADDVLPMLIELQKLNIVKLYEIENHDKTPGSSKTKVFIEFETPHYV